MHDDDATDLRRFAEDGDEGAFATVVQRHLGLVYSAALRQVNGDAHLAQDVAQSVFTDLARKAGTLAPRAATLAGWLYTSTHHAAAHAVRAEQRRRRREQEAHAMQELSDDAARDAAWAQVRPHLDALMQRLSREDRDAIVQRYFAGRSFPEMAGALGVSENGARMRVERALEKLRVLLERHGVRSSATVLGGVLATEALAAPPAGLAASITTLALAKAGGAGLAAGALGLFGMTKIQTTILVAAAATGLVAVGVDVRAQRHLQARVDSVAATQPADVPDAHVESLNTPGAPAATAPDDAQLARLRAEKAALEARLREAPLATASLPKAGPSTSAATAAVSGPVFDFKEVDVGPKAMTQVAPRYPGELKALGVQGEAIVSFVVNEQGEVVDVQPEDATHPAFALAAMDALAQWKFAPGQKEGMPVHVRMRQPFRFAIQNDEWF